MKIALLFPGYGSQYVGMGKELYDEYRIVQEYFEEASQVLNNNFVKLCFASSAIELSKLGNAYTSLFLVGSATYALLKENGIEPDIVAGYNNGETTALYAASCFSLPDGLYLLHKFCSFYQEMIDTMNVDSMLITGVSSAQLENACKQVNNDGKVFIAIYNSQNQHIVAGNRNQLEQVYDIFSEKATMEYIGAEVGLHSLLMNGIVDSFKNFLEKVDFKDLKIPLISCIDGTIITAGTDAKERFISFINSPLKWYSAMKALEHYDCILIASPGGDLVEMIKEQYPEKVVMAVATKEDVDRIKEMVNNVKHEKTGLINDN
jgi:[acyl-carrier-protein] S-malonyltransferase